MIDDMTGRSAVPKVIWARPRARGPWSAGGPQPGGHRGRRGADRGRGRARRGLDAACGHRAGLRHDVVSDYVPRKEDLYELMVDAISGEHDSWEPTGDWRADMLRVAHQTRALMHRHPWLPRLMSPVYGFSPNALRYLEHCLVCLDPLDASYGTKMELIAMLNGVVTTYVGNELATAERTRSLPWSAEQEQAMRIAYLGSRIATGAYPRMAAAFTQDAGPIDLEAVFERALGRVLDAFEPKR